MIGPTPSARTAVPRTRRRSRGQAARHVRDADRARGQIRTRASEQGSAPRPACGAAPATTRRATRAQTIRLPHTSRRPLDDLLLPTLVAGPGCGTSCRGRARHLQHQRRREEARRASNGMANGAVTAWMSAPATPGADQHRRRRQLPPAARGRELRRQHRVRRRQSRSARRESRRRGELDRQHAAERRRNITEQRDAARDAAADHRKQLAHAVDQHFVQRHSLVRRSSAPRGCPSAAAASPCLYERGRERQREVRDRCAPNDVTVSETQSLRKSRDSPRAAEDAANPALQAIHDAFPVCHKLEPRLAATDGNGGSERLPARSPPRLPGGEPRQAATSGLRRRRLPAAMHAALRRECERQPLTTHTGALSWAARGWLVGKEEFIVGTRANAKAKCDSRRAPMRVQWRNHSSSCRCVVTIASRPTVSCRCNAYCTARRGGKGRCRGTPQFWLNRLYLDDRGYTTMFSMRWAVSFHGARSRRRSSTSRPPAARALGADRQFSSIRRTGSRTRAARARQVNEPCSARTRPSTPVTFGRRRRVGQLPDLDLPPRAPSSACRPLLRDHLPRMRLLHVAPTARRTGARAPTGTCRAVV